MSKDRTNLIFSLLLGSIIILMMTNLIMFYRINQLHEQIINVLKPLTPPKGLSVGSKAPPFILKDLENKNYALENMKGGKVLLVFSSTTCPACKNFWPVLSKFHDVYQDLPIVMISKGSVTENQIVVKEENFDFPVLIWDNEVVGAYEVPGTPYLYLLSEDQKILFSGFVDELQQVETIIKTGG